MGAACAKVWIEHGNTSVGLMWILLPLGRMEKNHVKPCGVDDVDMMSVDMMSDVDGVTEVERYSSSSFGEDMGWTMGEQGSEDWEVGAELE